MEDSLQEVSPKQQDDQSDSTSELCVGWIGVYLPKDIVMGVTLTVPNIKCNNGNMHVIILS